MGCQSLTNLAHQTPTVQLNLTNRQKSYVSDKGNNFVYGDCEQRFERIVIKKMGVHVYRP